jgi:hypothetical protein
MHGLCNKNLSVWYCVNKERKTEENVPLCAAATNRELQVGSLQEEQN